MREELRKESKGITLIALVITIIVLLILAGVAIVTLTGENGILTQAGKAKTETTDGEKEEQINLLSHEWIIEKNTSSKTLEEFLNEKIEEGKLSSVKKNEDGTYTIKLNGYQTIIDQDGKIISTGPWKQEGDTIINTQTNQTIKVGDYVKYDPTSDANASDLTYSSPASKTGADSDQDFDAQTYKDAGYGWRVLGVANGKIRLISEEFVGAGTYTDSNRTYYTLKGQNGYINGIDELNKISAIFGHGKGAESATSITADDINSITGYNPETAKYREGNFCEYGNKVTYTRGEGSALSSSATNGEKWSGTQSTFNYYDKATKTFKTLTSGSTDIESTYYRYVPGKEFPDRSVDESGTYNEVYQMIFGKYTMTAESGYYRDFTGKGAAPEYWLASGYACAYSYYVDWGLRFVNGGGVDGNSEGGYYLYVSGDYENDKGRGVRPVVSLKSDISLEWNETAQEWDLF